MIMDVISSADNHPNKSVKSSCLGSAGDLC